MITINLVSEAQSEGGAGRLVVAVYVASLLLVTAAGFLAVRGVASEVADLKERRASLESDIARYKEKTKEVSGLEQKRKDLADKIAVISRLKKSKSGPVRVLDDLNTALPDRAWIEEIADKGGALNIIGLALDNQAVSNFMYELSKSSYFGGVELIESKLSELAKGERVKSFKVKASVSYAGGAPGAAGAAAPAAAG